MEYCHRLFYEIILGHSLPKIRRYSDLEDKLLDGVTRKTVPVALSESGSLEHSL